MNYPQGQRGKIFALLILLIPLFLLVNHVVVPAWTDYSAINEDIDDARFEVSRYQRMAADLSNLKQQESVLSKRKPLAPYLLPGNNRSLAAANMQRRLQSLVKQNRGRILSTRVLKHKTAGTFEQVSLNTRFQLSVTGLQKVLYTLETATPYMFVEQINVTAKRVRRGGNPDELDVRLTLHSLRAPDQGGQGG